MAAAAAALLYRIIRMIRRDIITGDTEVIGEISIRRHNHPTEVWANTTSARYSDRFLNDIDSADTQYISRHAKRDTSDDSVTEPLPPFRAFQKERATTGGRHSVENRQPTVPVGFIVDTWRDRLGNVRRTIKPIWMPAIGRAALPRPYVMSRAMMNT
jgi:hypothetical protein